MGNTDNNESKKCRSKIRIRLTDPNIPDSYVCELFDSSFENEEEISHTEEPLTEKTSKPKNYFEVLMSRKFKKTNGISSTKENSSKLPTSDDEIFEKNKKKYSKSKNSLIHSVHLKQEKRKLETDSSEDESLLEIQKKCQLKNYNSKDADDCVLEIIQETPGSIKTDEKEVFSSLKSSKFDLSQKKTLSLLNYFSKTEVNIKKVKLNEEITAVQNSTKIPKSLKAAKKTSDETSCSEQNIFLNGINKENVKLAPLFYKKETSVLDEAQQKARLDFLYNTTPRFVKKSNNKTADNFLSFTKVFHIQQRNDNVCWSHRDVCLPLRKICYSDEWRFNSDKKFNLKIENSTVHNVMPNNMVKLNKNFFHKAKCKYVELNLNLVIDGLKVKSDKYLARVKEFEKFKISASKQNSNDEIGFEELNTLWTEKYKPKSTEILGNENIVKKFKKWLQSWKSFDEELKALVKSSRNSEKKKGICSDSDDDDDDFLSSENEDFGLKAPCNVCIISGPNGCGKTSLVYALANELEFGIIELNAASKRTGRKVLSDLQEATQSHKVSHVNCPQSDALQKIKKTKNNKRKKKEKIKKPAKMLEQTNDCKISLILIEDADIVFDDHDEGFFSAVTSLVQTSKRPLIFLSNVPDCQCLYNLKTEQCLVFRMEPPCFYKSCAVLDIITQLEGDCFDREFLESLFCHNNFDLRKSLLELQFWNHSNQNLISSQSDFDLGRLWWGLTMFLYKQRMKDHVIPNISRRKKVSDLFDSSDDELETLMQKTTHISSDSVKSLAITRISDSSVESYFRVLDAASVLDRFSSIMKSCCHGSSEPTPAFDYKPKDSLSLDENMEDVFWLNKNLTERLSSEVISLSAKIFRTKIKEKENDDRTLSYLSPSWEEIRWRNARVKAGEELSALVSLQKGRDERSLHMDYLPMLRNICRIERNRSEINPKRKNRFYHYLHSMGLELSDENLEINCSVFSQ